MFHVGVHHPHVSVEVVGRDGLVALRAGHVAVTASQGTSPRHHPCRRAAPHASASRQSAPATRVQECNCGRQPQVRGGGVAVLEHSQKVQACKEGEEGR